MKRSSRTLNLTFVLVAITIFAPLGCNSAGGQGAGATAAGDLSGPLVMLPQYQGRAPRTCKKVTSPPSAAQAPAMVQCAMDSLDPTGLTLTQDIKLDMGASRRFVYNTDAGLAGIDLNAQVYPLRGSYTWYFCRTIGNGVPAGASCVKNVVPVAQGWCWKTSFGDWSCKMQGGAPKMEAGAAPTTY